MRSGRAVRIAGPGLDGLVPAFGYGFLEESQDRLFSGTDICAPSNQTPLVDFLRGAADGGHLSREAPEKVRRRNAARLLHL